jgi:plasmid stabilization system protein ParE
VSALIVIAESAEQQLREAVDWWERNASRDVFLSELDRALALVSEVPGAGAPFTRAKRPGTRRLLLRRVRHWVYYAVDPSKEVVYVLAVWGNQRGADPPGL